MKNWTQTLTLGAMLSAAFLTGQLLPRWFPAAGSGSAAPAVGDPLPGIPVLEAQGRAPVNPPPAPEPTPPIAAPPPVVYSEESGQSASGNGFLAVTGSYGVGTSVLYLIDTQSRQLAVYEARGGGTDMRRIVLVGARKIDLDLQLEGYNDRSEYDYRKLRDLFQKRGSKDPEITTGLESAGTVKK